MPKLTLVEPEKSNAIVDAQPDPAQALMLLRDFIQIKDPAIQQAVLELVQALARVTPG